MNIIKKGPLANGALVVQPGAGGGFDENGLFSWTETRRCDIAFAAQYTPQYDTRHPEFTSLVLKSLDTQRLPLGVYEFTGTWRGILPGGFSGTQIGGGPIEEGLPDPIESVQSSSGETRIELNKNFSQFAGDANNPKNGAQFDPETGIFTGWAADAPLKFRGIEGFTTPSIIFTRVSYSIDFPTNGKNVGKINNPGGSYANAQLSGNENYLKIGGDSSQFGDVFQLRDSWLRSGPDGWNDEIYELG